MSIAVPIILAVALAVSLSGQGRWIWPNYQSEQDEKSEKQDESKDKSDESKDKSDKKSPEKGKSVQGRSSKGKGGNLDRSSSATAPVRPP